MEAAPHGFTCTYIIKSRVSLKIAFLNLSKLVGVDLDVNAIRYLFYQICVVGNGYLPMWLNVDCNRRCLDQVEVN